MQNRYSASSSFCNLSDCFQNYYTFCRQDGGDCFPLAQSLRCYPLTFKMVRFCCSVKPSQLWWGLPHPHHQLDFPHHPSKTTNTLASLVKGRWIDGKAQAFILLLSACATSAFFIHQTFLPSRRRDCYIPSLRTTFLPPLVKGEVLSPKKFGRLPEGLSHLPYPFRFSDTSVNNLSFHTQPSQNRTIPFAFRVASSTAPLTAKIKSAPVFTGANSSSH